jgi:hypothetical protein
MTIAILATLGGQPIERRIRQAYEDHRDPARRRRTPWRELRQQAYVSRTNHASHLFIRSKLGIDLEHVIERFGEVA